jgi:hypothetical protein
MGTKGNKSSNIFQVLKSAGAWQTKDGSQPVIKNLGVKSPLKMGLNPDQAKRLEEAGKKAKEKKSWDDAVKKNKETGGGQKLTDYIKTRDSHKKGTKEYADAQNKINEAYNVKKRHTADKPKDDDKKVDVKVDDKVDDKPVVTEEQKKVNENKVKLDDAKKTLVSARDARKTARKGRKAKNKATRVANRLTNKATRLANRTKRKTDRATRIADNTKKKNDKASALTLNVDTKNLGKTNYKKDTEAVSKAKFDKRSAKRGAKKVARKSKKASPAKCPLIAMAPAIMGAVGAAKAAKK